MSKRRRKTRLDPGWAGDLHPEDMEHISVALMADADLAYLWGFRRNARRFPEAAIRAVALYGDPDDRKHNARLVAKAVAPAPVNPRQLTMAGV